MRSTLLTRFKQGAFASAGPQRLPYEGTGFGCHCVQEVLALGRFAAVNAFKELTLKSEVAMMLTARCRIVQTCPGLIDGKLHEAS